MLKSKTQTETNKYELKLSVSAEAFEEAVQKAYLAKKSKIAIPGFRPGKAPRKMIEAQYGEGVFWEDAVNALYGETVEEGVKEAELTLVAAPEVEVEEVSRENGVTFKVVCITKPEIKLGDVKGIKVKKTVNAVTDEMVDHEIGHLLERGARKVDVDDRAAQNGDDVVIDFEGFKDGVPFDGGKAEKYSLKLGSGQFIPGFEDQVVGHKIGEEFDINVTFPEDYQAKELAGAPVVFKIKLHEISYQELPELDDDFVKDTTDFETVDELKADTRKHLEEHAEEHANQELEGAIMDQVIGKVEGEIPEIMYENKVDEMVDEMAHRLSHQGLDLNTYLQFTGMTEEGLRTAYREQAEKQVKLRLALEQYVKENSVEVSDDELEEEYKKIGEQYNMPVETVKQYIRAEDLRLDAAVGKAVDEIKAAAVIEE